MTRKELAMEIIKKYGYTVRKYDNIEHNTIIHINDDYAKRLLIKKLKKENKKQLSKMLNYSTVKIEIAYFNWNKNRPMLLIIFKPKNNKILTNILVL